MQALADSGGNASASLAVPHPVIQALENARDYRLPAKDTGTLAQQSAQAADETGTPAQQSSQAADETRSPAQNSYGRAQQSSQAADETETPAQQSSQAQQSSPAQ